MGRPRIELQGKRFGRLRVLKYDGGPWQKWKCKCLCSKIISVIGGNLRGGSSLSCGCLQRDLLSKSNKVNKPRLRHGQSAGGKVSGIYQSWVSLKRRVYSDDPRWKHIYTDRGIGFSSRWISFDLFFQDMSSSWFSGAVLHRKDVWEGYGVNNCVWMSKSDHTALHSKLRGRKDYGK